MSLTKASYSMIQGAVINVFDYFSVAQIADVQAGTASIDCSSAIQTAIDATATTGNTLYFPTGVYLHTSTIVWKNGVNYEGSGINTSNTKGSVFKYTGTSNATQINNPINSSTFASIKFSGLTFVGLTMSVGKALLYDTGSTYLQIDRCKFSLSGVDSFGIVFDQTEVSSISNSILETYGANGSGALIWLADGATPQNPTGASAFTNRITITGNQINAAGGGANARGLLDSGGLVHTINDNNFNGGAYNAEFKLVTNLSFQNNEVEGSTINAIYFSYVNGGAAGVIITGNKFIGSGAILNLASGSVDRLTYTDNVIETTGIVETGVSATTTGKIFATNNRQSSTGSKPFNNYLTPNVETVGTVTLYGTSTAGTNTYSNNTMTWRLIGDMCFFNLYIILTAKDAAMAGNVYIAGLPYSSRAASAQTTSVSIGWASNITLDAGYTQMGAYIPVGQSYIVLNEIKTAAAAGLIPAANIANNSQIMISGLYPI